MRNYNVGDKFVIEIEEICGCTERNVCAEPHVLYRAKGFNTLTFDEPGLDKLERLDGDYVNENFGELQNEAYETGKDDRREEVLKWMKGNEEDFYNKGLNDVWELMKKVLLPVGSGGIETEQLNNMFDVPLGKRASHWILREFTPQEALAKLEAYEKEREEIKVGDVVYADDEPEAFGVVTWTNNKLVYIMWGDGSCGCDTRLEEVHKTGKHINISAILAEIEKE